MSIDLAASRVGLLRKEPAPEPAILKLVLREQIEDGGSEAEGIFPVKGCGAGIYHSCAGETGYCPKAGGGRKK